MCIPLHQIRGFMETRLGLSYKNGNWRPINLDRQKNEALQQLFVVILAQQLPHIKLLQNLDESSINRDTFDHYLWLKSGESWSLNNIVSQ